MAAQEHYKLIYFPVRNLAEAARMIFAYVNQPYEDVRIPMDEWPKLKPSTPFGTIPVLELGDGRRLGQSRSIIRYLAKKFGFGGKDIWQQAQLEDLADYQQDVQKAISPYIYTLVGFYASDKEKQRNEAFLPNADKFFPTIERLLSKESTKTGFLADSTTPTYVDFIYADYFSTIRGFEPDVMKQYPAICAHIEKIFNLPKLKNYIETRPKTPL